jgi:hypothetical protein
MLELALDVIASGVFETMMLYASLVQLLHDMLCGAPRTGRPPVIT